MKIAMIGLGRMGANMTERLIKDGHEVVAFDLSEEARQAVEAKGAQAVESVEDAVAALSQPRVVWVMLPAGDITWSTIDKVAGLMAKGDIIIDGGNSNYKEFIEAAERTRSTGIELVDAGVSGGIWGLDNGYCLMVGGTAKAVKVAEPLFVTLAPTDGYAHVGPPGAGHFVKMVHNGIEYGLMQAYAEGFEIMAAADEFDLDLHEIAGIWRYGSVVRSWLLELIERALADSKNFASIKGVVADSGEGRWTVTEAVDRGVPAPVITASLFSRFATRDEDSLASRLTAAMRQQFGGHAVESEQGDKG